MSLLNILPHSPSLPQPLAFIGVLLSDSINLTIYISKYILHSLFVFSQFSSVTQLCPTLCGPVDSSTPGFPIHNQLLELTQIHVHRIGDAIQQSYPLSSPSPPAINLSQHQGLFQ